VQRRDWPFDVLHRAPIEAQNAIFVAVRVDGFVLLPKARLLQHVDQFVDALVPGVVGAATVPDLSLGAGLFAILVGPAHLRDHRRERRLGPQASVIVRVPSLDQFVIDRVATRLAEIILDAAKVAGDQGQPARHRLHVEEAERLALGRGHERIQAPHPSAEVFLGHHFADDLDARIAVGGHDAIWEHLDLELHILLLRECQAECLDHHVDVLPRGHRERRVPGRTEDERLVQERRAVKDLRIVAQRHHKRRHVDPLGVEALGHPLGRHDQRVRSCDRLGEPCRQPRGLVHREEPLMRPGFVLGWQDDQFAFLLLGLGVDRWDHFREGPQHVGHRNGLDLIASANQILHRVLQVQPVARVIVDHAAHAKREANLAGAWTGPRD
jgi:hypothetical protein